MGDWVFGEFESNVKGLKLAGVFAPPLPPESSVQDPPWIGLRRIVTTGWSAEIDINYLLHAQVRKQPINCPFVHYILTF